MNSKINDGGSAFPQYSLSAPEFRGMSLRQWYAGMALSGAITTTSSVALAAAGSGNITSEQIKECFDPGQIAGIALQMADALIALEASTRQASQVQ